MAGYIAKLAAHGGLWAIMAWGNKSRNQKFGVPDEKAAAAHGMDDETEKHNTNVSSRRYPAHSSRADHLSLHSSVTSFRAAERGQILKFPLVVDYQYHARL